MSISNLVNKYEMNRDYYLSGNYNETQLRNEFLDEFFELLGWDIKNKNCKSTFEREVILEESIKGNEQHIKKPDYTFRLFNQRKFFLEAKKPSVKIECIDEPAHQIRKYGFTAKLKISVLSNFEYLVIYDCSKPVNNNDKNNICLVRKYHYTEYEECFDEIKSYLGRESVYSGNFDKTWEYIEQNIKNYNVDNLFLKQINDWRLILGKSIYRIKPNIEEIELNDCVQSYINSIIFLRVCEDRNIEKYHSLIKIKDENNFSLLLKKFHEADIRYNSGLFKLPYQEEIIERMSSVFWDIISQLYYPNSPYSFAVFSSDILGNIYEIFLRDKLYIRENEIEIDRKPENIDRDIVSTPLYIIQNILDLTLSKRMQNIDIDDILSLKVADISCGSGSFLLEAYQYINDYLIDYYINNDCSKLIKTGINTFKLDYEIKKKIIVDCIYGIDKDYNAVETTKFGLLLKLLENETVDSLPKNNAILPELKHIYCGNSLINSYDIKTYSTEQKQAINPFDFNELKFDIIIGNPPYMKTEDIKNLTPFEKTIYEKKFKSTRKQYDKYFLFIEQSLNYLNKNGLIGYILPNKITKVDAGKNLRELLKQNKNIKNIISFGANQIFEDKTTYTNILILDKHNNETFDYIEINDLDSYILKQDNHKNGYKAIKIAELNSDGWILYSNQYDEIYNKILENSIPLVDLTGGLRAKNIANGIQTSRNDMFVINPYKEENGLLFFNKTGKRWCIEKDITRPYYETPGVNLDDNLNTYRYLKPNSFVIYPYQLINNRIEYIELNEIKTNYPNAYKYFTENKHKFLYSSKNTLRDIKPEPKSENEWHRYGREQALKIGEVEQKIVVGILSIGDKYAIDNNKTLISSGGTAGYCMIGLPSDSLYSIYYIQAILNSKMVEWITSLYGEIFRGGYIARGTKVLYKLPIKKIDFDDTSQTLLHDNIVELQSELINIHTQAEECRNNKRDFNFLSNKFKKTKTKLDNKLKSLYNLTDSEYEKIPVIKEIYALNRE